jgi:hypothetical protein
MPNHHEKDLTAVLCAGQPTAEKAAPAGHSSGGVSGCQADSAVSPLLWSGLRRRGRGRRRLSAFESAM